MGVFGMQWTILILIITHTLNRPFFMQIGPDRTGSDQIRPDIGYFALLLLLCL